MTLPTIAKLWGIEWLFLWQIPLVVLLIGIIVFYVMYRRKQM